MLKRYFRTVFLGSAFLCAFGAANLLAQGTRTPQTYSLTLVTNQTEASMMTGRDSNLKVARNGSREAVDLTVAPRGSAAKGVHMRYLFDFQARKAYTLDVPTNACSWMSYVSADAPIEDDPITGSATMLPAKARAGLKMLGAQTINGIPAQAAEITPPKNAEAPPPGVPVPTLMKVWLAEHGGFVVKQEITFRGGGLMHMEVKQLSFAKPADSLLAPPANCSKHVQGEWSDMGVNAHTEAPLK
jgi:hypothetical protein